MQRRWAFGTALLLIISPVLINGGGPSVLTSASSCSEDAARAAFSAGDISQARAILAAYKDGPKEARSCAVQTWQAGIESLTHSAEVGRTKHVASDSRVLERLGSTGCNAQVDDGSWLSIPRLQEILICVQLRDHRIVLEQDGFLRAFDMATVIWPAGFFLTMWVESNCHLVSGNLLELGTGVGASSIMASLCGGNVVLSTDAAQHGLFNAQLNANINNAAVSTQVLDWNSDADVEAAAAKGPFDVILGAGLAPHRWEAPMWKVLLRLLRSSGRLVLCHGVGDIEGASVGKTVGNGTFLVQHVLPGDEYGLQTRWGTESEFELLILHPVRRHDEF